MLLKDLLPTFLLYFGLHSGDKKLTHTYTQITLNTASH